MNQGMLLESLNLASAWNLPVLFVCKDDGWSITTPSKKMTGGDLINRAVGLGVPAADVDGTDVSQVWEASRPAIERARSDLGPTFLRCRCVHLEGHFLGFQLLRIVRDPVRELPPIALPLTRSLLRPGGAALREGVAGLFDVLAAVFATLRDPRRDSANDPISRTRKTLLSDRERLTKLEDQIERELNHVLASALAEVPA